MSRDADPDEDPPAPVPPAHLRRTASAAVLSQAASRPIAIVPGGPHRATMAMMRSAAMPHDRGNPRVLAHQHAARAEIEAEAAALAAAAMASARRGADGISGAAGADSAADHPDSEEARLRLATIGAELGGGMGADAGGGGGGVARSAHGLGGLRGAPHAPVIGSMPAPSRLHDAMPPLRLPPAPSLSPPFVPRPRLALGRDASDDSDGGDGGSVAGRARSLLHGTIMPIAEDAAATPDAAAEASSAEGGLAALGLGDSAWPPPRAQSAAAAAARDGNVVSSCPARLPLHSLPLRGGLSDGADRALALGGAGGAAAGDASAAPAAVVAAGGGVGLPTAAQGSPAPQRGRTPSLTAMEILTAAEPGSLGAVPRLAEAACRSPSPMSRADGDDGDGDGDRHFGGGTVDDDDDDGDARHAEGCASDGARHADAPPSNRDRSQTGDDVDPDGAAGPFDFEL